MRTSLIYILLLKLFVTNCCAQNTSSKNVYENLDTISLYYPQMTFDTLKDGPNRYYVNGIRVDKRTSNISQSNAQLIDKCRPCILKIYDSITLIMCGVQSGDGRTGFWFEYYPKTGKLKTKGHYKETLTGNCTQSVCSVKDGEWLYYNQKGRLLIKENYSNGILITRKKF